ncbi:MAG: serine protease Do [Lentimonas sp.]|jgi:serine protease Do
MKHTQLASIVLLSFGSCIGQLGQLSAAENPALEVVLDARPISADQALPVVSYADVLDKATPAVVSVYTSEIVTSSATPDSQIPDFFRQFGIPVPRNLQPAQPQPDKKQPLGVGSGVIVSTDGYIVTNNHVVVGRSGEPADEILVRLSDNREYSAILIGADSKTDVAVLKIEADEALPAITMGKSDQLRVGDVVFAIGNPLDVGLTATQGIISAIGRTSYGILGPGAYENFIQTDAAINMGNSGGALVDAWGRLIGINTAIVSRSGGSNGIGFAIPTNLALNVMTKLIESGEVPRGLLGLLPENLNRDMADAFGLKSTKGALVNQVQADSPAQRAGVQHGDVILRVNDIEIESAPQLRLVISQMLPGSEVLLSLVRKKKEMALKVVLGSLDGTVAQVNPLESRVLDGVSVAALNAALREEFSIPAEVEGLVVTDLSFDSPYANVLTQGMVIIEVNGQAVTSVDTLKAAIETGVNRVYSWFGGINRYIVLRIK